MKLLKIIHPEFAMSYPAMTVYEFEHFKKEEEVLECWHKSSVYIICQRPVLYFDEIIVDQETSGFTLKIKQRNDEREVLVNFNIPDNDSFFESSDGVWSEINYYDEEHSNEQPYMNVAGIKFFDNKHEFIFWMTPERLLYSFWTGQFAADFEGDIHDFLKYTVHYIGQSKNQNIWDRLTGHEKLSKVLALEHPFIKGEFSSYELSLIFLELKGFREDIFFAPSDDESVEITDIYGNKLDEDEVANLCLLSDFETIKPYAINDFEAYLINMLEPEHNDIKFKNYPEIKSGFRSIGYAGANYKILLFASLVTDAASMNVTITPIYKEAS